MICINSNNGTEEGKRPLTDHLQTFLHKKVLDNRARLADQLNKSVYIAKSGQWYDKTLNCTCVIDFVKPVIATRFFISNSIF